MRQLHCFLAGLLIAASGFVARAEDKYSALEAIQALQSRFGPDVCEVLVAIHGQQGQEQPEEWVVLTLNSQSPNLGQQFAVSRNGVVDKGVPPGLYPDETPPGFINRSQVLIDSPYAFQVLQQAAVRAHVGFNSVNYTLVAKEYGKEPLWRLEPMDVKGRPVGQLDLSAKSGMIYRSIWYYWDEADAGSAWQGPRIVDSLLAEVAGAGDFAGSAAPVGAPVRAQPVEAAKPEPKEKGGLFSRLRRNSRSLFGNSASSNPSSSSAPVSAPVQTAPAPNAAPVGMAPEAGVAVPVPAGDTPTGPTAEVAPAPGTGSTRSPVTVPAR
jgi:hypothetical protein